MSTEHRYNYPEKNPFAKPKKRPAHMTRKQYDDWENHIRVCSHCKLELPMEPVHTSCTYCYPGDISLYVATRIFKRGQPEPITGSVRDPAMKKKLHKKSYQGE